MTGQTDGLTRIVAALVQRQVNFVVVGAWEIQAQNYERDHYPYYGLS